MKSGVIIQARTSSTRLPEKVLKELPYGSGITVLEQVIRRVKLSKKISTIIIATTNEKEDQPIIDIAEKEKVKWFKGSLNNVLSRYYNAAVGNELDIVVRVTSDCPCIDPEIIDILIEKHIKDKNDYTTNVLERTFPHGVDTEVLSFKILEEAFNNATEKHEKEHVTSYIYKTHFNKFKIENVKALKNYNRPDIRITLDTEEDYALLCSIYDNLYPLNPFFKINDIIKLFNNKPWLALINKKIVQKNIFNSKKEEIKEAIKVLRLQDLKNVADLLERLNKK